jgi:hypothetical protein
MVVWILLGLAAFLLVVWLLEHKDHVRDELRERKRR